MHAYVAGILSDAAAAAAFDAIAIIIIIAIVIIAIVRIPPHWREVLVVRISKFP